MTTDAQEQQAAEEDFGSAFEERSAEISPSAEAKAEPVETPEGAAGDKEGSEAVAEATTSSEDPPPANPEPTEPKVEEPKQVAQPKGKQTKQQAEDYEQKYRTLQGKYNAELPSERARAKALAEENERLKAELAAKAKPAETAPDDEDTAIRELEAEAPTVSTAVRAMLKKERAAFEESLQRTVAPVAQDVNARAAEAHFSAIRAAHSDFDVVKPDLITWVQEQPEWMRNALTPVLEKGSAQEVNDVISRFKKETGRQTPAPTPTPKPTPKPARNDGDIEAVRTRTPAASLRPGGASDPNDFGGAFEEAAAR